MILDNFKKLFKNFYFLFFILFILWMTFIDTNGFYNRYRLSKKLSDLESQKVFYTNEIEQISMDKKSFDNNDELLEKYAREKYLMKKDFKNLIIFIKNIIISKHLNI